MKSVNTQEEKNETIGYLILYFFRFILSYVSFVLFIPMVGLSLFVIWVSIMVLILRYGDYFVIFLESLLRLIGTTDLNEVGIIKIYFFLSLIFTIIFEVGKFVLKKIFKKEIKYSFKSKAKHIIILIHIIYLAALISSFYLGFITTHIASWLFSLFMIYVINIFMLGGYLFIQGLIHAFDNYLYPQQAAATPKDKNNLVAIPDAGERNGKIDNN